MELKGGRIIWSILVVLYSIVRVSPLDVPYCKDQWRDNLYNNTEATGHCKIQQKLGSVVDMYCDVDSSKYTLIFWFHKFRGKWVSILRKNNPDWRPTVYLTKGNKSLTLLSTYIDHGYDQELAAYSHYNKNTDGRYICKAVSESDPSLRATRIFDLELYECAKRKDVFVHLTWSKVIKDIGSDVSSSCVADYGCYSVEPFTADWYLKHGPNYTKISDLNDGRYQVNSSVSNAGRHIVTTLIIRNIQRADFGDKLVCIVANSNNMVIKHLHINRVEVVKNLLPFPVLQVLLIPVIIVAPILILVFLVWYRRGMVALYVRSHYYDGRKGKTNKVFIFFDYEEKGSKDYYLANEIIERLRENYQVETSDTCIQFGEARNEFEGTSFEGSSTIFVILPDLTNELKFREMDNDVSRLYYCKKLSLRYLTVIDRSEENMKAVPRQIKNSFLLSKWLVHVTRPAKPDIKDEQTDLFFEKLKERTAPLPQNLKAEGNNNYLANLLTFCIRGKRAQYVYDL